MEGFESKNDAVKSVQEGIHHTFFKPCTFLQVIGGVDGYSFSNYRPYCQQDSFVQTRNGLYPRQCPADCSLFKDRYVLAAQEAKEEKRQKHVRLAKTIFLGPFIWFGKLPTLTQALLLFIIIVLVSPKLASSVIAIIKSLK